MNNTVVQTIKQQLVSLGVKGTFVAWDANSLKVSRGARGAIIEYDSAADLYNVTRYNGFDCKPVKKGVQVADLKQAVGF